jgi:formate/nitrite transporter
MAFKSPPEIAEAGAKTGATKAAMPWNKALVGGILAGAYIGFAGLLAIVCSAGMNPDVGTISLVTGGVFTLGLVLVIIAGSELLTGNMALLPLGLFTRRVTGKQFLNNFVFVIIGNLIGSLLIAYFLAVKTGVVTDQPALDRLKSIATIKGGTETDWQIFLRAVGCNWLVCLAVWMALAADDIGGKILAIFFPIMGFVAIGFDHVVANMFFLPAAIFADVPGIGWGDTLNNWLFAFLGNFVGAALFVSASYWYLYLKDDDDDDEPAGGGAPPEDDRASDGRFAPQESTSRSAA